MNDFIIVSDSCCDLNKEMRDKLGIEYFQMRVNDGAKEYVCDLDWAQFSAKEFYDNMRGGTHYRTSAVPIADFIDGFEAYVKKGLDVLYIGCSSALSGSVNFAKQAKEEVLERFPDAKILIIDSLISMLGMGILLIEASEMKKAGSGIDEIYAYIEENKLNVHQVATVDELQYIRRAGRITGAKAFFGSILKVKPLIISDAKGQNATIGKAKGRKNSFMEIIRLAKDYVIDAPGQTLYLTHADCLDEAEQLAEDMVREIGFKDYYIAPIGPCVGSTVGPGTVSTYFTGKKMTEVYDD